MRNTPDRYAFQEEHMRKLAQMEMARIAGGVGEPDESPHLPLPGGISEAEWQQWLDFFEEQARRNQPRP
ncbi:hypothetical protein EIM50_11355 [Pseudoxanthomonas sp. SGD-10]|nr:hypothetical protein EIM50_11355 [Pseudoxanthomonas sp. SGD-10]